MGGQLDPGEFLKSAPFSWSSVPPASKDQMFCSVWYNRCTVHRSRWFGKEQTVVGFNTFTSILRLYSSLHGGVCGSAM